MGRADEAGGLAPFVAELAADPRSAGVIRLPSRPGRTGSWPTWLDPSVRTSYEQRGIELPWRHQVETAELAWSGRHVVIATGTASGKSAAFGMPALTAALQAPARAGVRGPSVLYLSPTKALAHDQLAGLRSLGRTGLGLTGLGRTGPGLTGLRAAALDGDSPDEQRAWARAHARWIVTNPDMLHHAILPRHESWRGFLRSLRFVIVDEAHTYRGVFGSNVALVLRRLRRVAALHGASPTFIAASATVADPGATAGALLGLEMSVVDVDDSARGGVDIVLWNPSRPAQAAAQKQPSGQLDVPDVPDVPEENAAAAATEATDVLERPGPAVEADEVPPYRGTLPEAAELMGRLVDAGTSTLAFARSRRAVEILAGAVREHAVQGDRVRGYRGGYLPEERRALEADLRTGRLLGLATTNALELGIDISGLDAVLLVGWPGTRSSFWQQVGRTGRTGGRALAVLVAGEDPLDQYVVNHPRSITGAPVEATVLDPANPYVLAGHLCAAAAEAPLRAADLGDWFGPGAEQLCTVLTERGLLRRRRDGWYWTDSVRAADLVDLRGTGGGPVRVVEYQTGRLLGTVDPSAAPAAVHEGALYVHQGQAHDVLNLDLDARVAIAAQTVTDLSTHARSTADVTLDVVRASTRWGRVDLSCAEVSVTRQVRSYLVRRWPSGEVLAEHPLDLPAMTLQTVGMFWSIPDEVLREADISEADVPGAVHALEHASIGILPLLATCDRWDLGGVSSARHPQTGQAIIVVHDGHPGGAGFAERGFHSAVEWLGATTETIADCPCADGCPACVQSPKCGNGNEPLDKAAALRLARILLAEQCGQGEPTEKGSA